MPPLVSPRTPHKTGNGMISSSPSYFGFNGETFNGPVQSPSTRTRQHPQNSATPPSNAPPKPLARQTSSRRQSESCKTTCKGFNNGSPGSPRSTKDNRRSAEGTAAIATLTKSQTIGDEDLAEGRASTEATNWAQIPGIPGHLYGDATGSYGGNGLARSITASPTKQLSGEKRLSLPGKDSKYTKNQKDNQGQSSNSADPVGVDMMSSKDVAELIQSCANEILILDLRVSTQHAKSRISGALNLCIPTTLLKRPSFNVQRLAETFKDRAQRSKFDLWQKKRYLIVHDTSSSQLKEAANCANILKKFASEGWQGKSCIIKGGFIEFSRRFNDLVDHDSTKMADAGSANLKTKVDSSEVPPVIGGCPMPATKSAADPFFGNIRQNMDLIGGVGQMPVHCPESMSNQTRYDMPEWLQKATNDEDKGQSVSDKFLAIEKREQKRMQSALSDKPAYHGLDPEPETKVQIAGIEKGSKNRYNNIWPFEHSRVKLQDVSPGGCDYVNASFLENSMSEKNYIATQGPIPSTFGDFWKMVWQQDVQMIVMLTAESEGGQLKAHNYWQTMEYGPIRLTLHSERRLPLEPGNLRGSGKPADNSGRRASHLDTVRNHGENDGDASADNEPFVIIRNLSISHTAHPFERVREITHVQYPSWPDFGAPAHPAHLLRLVENCDRIAHSISAASGGSFPSLARCPVVVHCSAGCGRTGTFCTVDTVIDILKSQRRQHARTRQGSPMDIDSETSIDSRFDLTLKSSESARKDIAWSDKRINEVDLVDKAVEEFRLQRLSTVQCLRQYVLCYETVLEWISGQSQPKTAA
ncbi:MAG: hypothetical protein M1831_004971 [Alyxoria varia]|nr:MAG: hypothetical protein M1831_004971 [Alyxoria varia]